MSRINYYRTSNLNSNTESTNHNHLQTLKLPIWINASKEYYITDYILHQINITSIPPDLATTTNSKCGELTESIFQALNDKKTKVITYHTCYNLESRCEVNNCTSYLNDLSMNNITLSSEDKSAVNITDKYCLYKNTEKFLEFNDINISYDNFDFSEMKKYTHTSIINLDSKYLIDKHKVINKELANIKYVNYNISDTNTDWSDNITNVFTKITDISLDYYLLHKSLVHDTNAGNNEINIFMKSVIEITRWFIETSNEIELKYYAEEFSKAKLFLFIAVNTEDIWNSVKISKLLDKNNMIKYLTGKNMGWSDEDVKEIVEYYNDVWKRDWSIALSDRKEHLLINNEKEYEWCWSKKYDFVKEDKHVEYKDIEELIEDYKNVNWGKGFDIKGVYEVDGDKQSGKDGDYNSNGGESESEVVQEQLNSNNTDNETNLWNSTNDNNNNGTNGNITDTNEEKGTTEEDSNENKNPNNPEINNFANNTNITSNDILNSTVSGNTTKEINVTSNVDDISKNETNQNNNINANNQTKEQEQDQDQLNITTSTTNQTQEPSTNPEDQFQSINNSTQTSAKTSLDSPSINTTSKTSSSSTDETISSFLKTFFNPTQIIITIIYYTSTIILIILYIAFFKKTVSYSKWYLINNGYDEHKIENKEKIFYLIFFVSFLSMIFGYFLYWDILICIIFGINGVIISGSIIFDKTGGKKLGIVSFSWLSLLINTKMLFWNELIDWAIWIKILILIGLTILFAIVGGLLGDIKMIEFIKEIREPKERV